MAELDPLTIAVVTKSAELVVKEVAEQAVAPPARELGKTLALPFEAINTALRPVKSILLAFNQVFDRLDERIKEKLKDVPAGQIVEPPANVAGPLLLGYAFVEGEPTLQDLYEQLLAASMIADTQSSIHPSFTDVLRQLTPDEGKIIKSLHTKGKAAHPVVQVRLLGSVKGIATQQELGLIWDFYDDADLVHPEFNGTYLDNLIRLGILRLKLDDKLVTRDYSQLERHALETIAGPPTEGKVVNVICGSVEMTRFGQHFVLACNTGLKGWPPTSSEQKAATE